MTEDQRNEDMQEMTDLELSEFGKTLRKKINLQKWLTIGVVGLASVAAFALFLMAMNSFAF